MQETICLGLLRLLQLIFLIIRVFNRQTPDIEIIADGRDNIILRR